MDARCTPLHYAMRAGDERCVALLLAAGAAATGGAPLEKCKDILLPVADHTINAGAAAIAASHRGGASSSAANAAPAPAVARLSQSPRDICDVRSPEVLPAPGMRGELPVDPACVGASGLPSSRLNLYEN